MLILRRLYSHLQYFWYVLRHKWFVFVECCRLGVPLRGIVHDLSKFLPSEWFAYVHAFYPIDAGERVEHEETEDHDPGSVAGAFDLAWLLHQKRNPHHWQYWVLIQDDDLPKVLPMPDGLRREMLADWRGAGRAQGKADPNDCLRWYLEHREKMELHPDTRKWIDDRLVLGD